MQTRSLLDGESLVLTPSSHEYLQERGTVSGLVRMGSVVFATVAVLVDCGRVKSTYSWTDSSMPQRSEAMILTAGATCVRLAVARSSLAVSVK